jgi:hypothetical protein
MTITINEARGDQCIVSFGPVLRSDKLAKFRFYTWEVTDTGDGIPSDPVIKLIRQGPLPKKGRLHLTLPAGTRCLILAGGAEKAGVIDTKEHSLMAPFYISMDAEPSMMPARLAAEHKRQTAPKRKILNGAIARILRR